MRLNLSTKNHKPSHNGVTLSAGADGAGLQAIKEEQVFREKRSLSSTQNPRVFYGQIFEFGDLAGGACNEKSFHKVRIRLGQDSICAR